MPDQFEERVSNVFTGPDAENSEKYLELLMSSWNKSADAVTKKIVLIFLVAGIFELLVVKSAAASVSVGSIALTNSSTVQFFIPSLIAYLLYDCTCKVELWWAQAEIYKEITKKCQPKLWESDLGTFVAPQPSGPWTFKYREEDEFMSKGRKFEENADVLIGAISYLLPLAFEAQAYYLLGMRYGLSNSLYWISISTSMLFIIIWAIRSFLLFQAHLSN